MNDLVKGLTESYKFELKEYISAEHKDVLRHAAEFGKMAMSGGLGILDVVAIHRQSMAAILPGSMTAEQNKRATDFFVASLAPFENELHELRDTNARMRQELSPPPAKAQPREETPQAEVPAGKPPLRHQRILLVEDSEDILLLMKAELEWLGYSVFAASDAKTGMEIAIRERPDVLISDIKMPDVDGYDLIKSLRLVPEFAATPAIALTGFGLDRDIEKALAAGYDAHLSKPADSSVLSDLIQKLTSNR